MDAEFDIMEIARWAISQYGAQAVAVIKRRAAENLMAEDYEAAECWRRVAEAANNFLCGRTVH